MKNFKILYYIWVAVAAAVMILITFIETQVSLIAVMAVVMCGGAAIISFLKKTLVKVVVEEDAIHLYTFDGKKRSIIPKGVVLIKPINSGTGITLRDGSNYRAREGKVIIEIGDEILHEFDPDDFPYAEFKK